MAQTQSTSFFSGLRDDLATVGIDILRARFIDTEHTDDGDNVPDQADLRAGFTGQETFLTAPAGVPLSTWLLIGAAVVAGVVVFKKFL